MEQICKLKMKLFYDSSMYFTSNAISMRVKLTNRKFYNLKYHLNVN